MNLPSRTTTTLVAATATSGSYVYNMQGIDRASLQLHATWDTTDTTTITLKLSNDNANFDAFSTAKTLSVSGTTDGIFELGAIDYAFLQVSWTAPAGTHHLTLTGTLYATPTVVYQIN